MSDMVEMFEALSNADDSLLREGVTTDDLVELIEGMMTVAECVEDFTGERTFTRLESTEIEDTVAQWIEDCEDANCEEVDA